MFDSEPGTNSTDVLQVSYWLTVCSDVALAAAPNTAPGQQAPPASTEHDGSDEEAASDSDEDAGTAAAIPSQTAQPDPSPEAASAAAIMGNAILHWPIITRQNSVCCLILPGMVNSKQLRES